MPSATLHDGSLLAIEVAGEGPAVLLPVNPVPIEGPRADEMRQWGGDPALGRSLIDGLRNAFRVIAFDYEGHLLAAPEPDTLTPDAVAADILAVADAAGADRFAYYGYSWLALAGLQLAIRTSRLSALAMGGFPPLHGPYREMLRVTTAAHDMAVAQLETGAAARAGSPVVELGMPVEPGDWSSVPVALAEQQTRQFVTLYRALADFDDAAIQSPITCPRLCFAGSADEITYGQDWGGVVVSIGPALAREREGLEALGWEVLLLDGLDHMGAMQAAAVLPILRPWLAAAMGTR